MKKSRWQRFIEWLCRRGLHSWERSGGCIWFHNKEARRHKCKRCGLVREQRR